MKNYGTFKKEVVINQLPEEEIYFSHELISEEDYINLGDLINDNGGLLSIPELFNTDITFYIIRYWGRKILKIFNILHQNNICVKYLNLTDFYVSRDGREIKIRNLDHLSSFNNSGRIFFGPDLNIILCFYRNYMNFENAENTENKVNQNNDESSKDSDSKADNSNNLNNKGNPLISYDIEMKLHYSKLDYNDYNDAYIAPDFMLKDVKELTNKTDTWIFGTLLFHILYGQTPISYIEQLKDWCDNQTNLIFEKITFPFDIASKHFFYNPFKKNFLSSEKENIFENINTLNSINYSTLESNRSNKDMKLQNNELASNNSNVICNIKSFIMENENLIQATKMNSYSATVNHKHLNPETETNKNINGLGIVLDMIACCLNVDENKRADLCGLYQSDLFKFDNYEMILVNKFAYNTLRYLSPEAIILNKILIPLREVKFFSAKIILTNLIFIKDKRLIHN